MAKQRIKIIDGHTAMDSDTSGEIDLAPYSTLQRVSVYSKYSGVSSGLDGTIKIYTSDEPDLINGKALAATITTNAASNLTDCNVTVIEAGAETIQVVYTSNSNTGTGTLEVDAIVEYL